MKNIKITLLGIIAAFSIVTGIVMYGVLFLQPGNNYDGYPLYEIKNFESYQDFNEFLSAGSSSYLEFGRPLAVPSEEQNRLGDAVSDTSDLGDTSIEGGSTISYSQTNVQVAGVDEPDVVKSDGTYLYIIANNEILIVKAYPTQDAQILSTIMVADNTTAQNLFIDGTKLIVFIQSYSYSILRGMDEMSVAPSWYSSPETYVKIYDLTSITTPVLIKEITITGTYSGARMIDHYVYVITVEYSYMYTIPETNDTFIPTIFVNQKEKEIPLSNIYYIDLPEKSGTITSIISIDVMNESKDITAKIYLLGDSHTIYVSKNNIYISYSTSTHDYELIQNLLDENIFSELPSTYEGELLVIESLSLDEYQKQTIKEWILQHYIETIEDEEKQEILMELAKSTERTILHRIAISNGDIQYESQGTIPGYILNQFSLSEYNEYLRVSTTLHGWIVRSYVEDVKSQNNVYILDMDLNVVGSVENIAPGEQIFATRFIADKCYLVTFEKTDPFFVIDVSDPTNPTILGELKIPGFSTYLHPYDETHIIGIGRDEQKVKLSLFDVSDLNNPIELSTYQIENTEAEWSWTQSSALYEHKAFLFSKEKNLLVIPVGDYSKESAYVFNVTAPDGIDLKGVVTHDVEMDEENGNQWDIKYYWSQGNSIKRILYIMDVLYTVSDNLIKMNNLDDLSELNSILLK